MGAAFWNVSWFDDISDTRLAIALGKFSIIGGGGLRVC